MKRLAFIVSLLLVSGAAFADAVNVEITNRATLGKGVPALHVQILERIAGFQVKLKRNDGKVVDVKGGGTPGVTRTLQLDQPEGRFHYQGEVVVLFPNDESASMPLEFDTEVYGQLRVQFRRDDIDLAKRRIVFRATRPVSKVDVQVVMDTGEVAHDAEIPFDEPAPGTPLEVTWPKASGEVLKISVRAHDSASYYDGFEVFPYEVYVPHDEINFETGKWDVLTAETPKLEKVFPEIERRVRKAQPWADVKLYIMGHTDTVGSDASNRTLSFNRARAIGQWFRKRGLRVAIYYEGFGERAPSVPTADETDEARNRRADYILSVEEPNLRNAPFPPKWRKL